MNGKFIVFEGPDGTGKSTIAKIIYNRLININKKAIYVYDPGYTEIGNKIRDILLDRKNNNICATTELLLYCASRAQLTKEVICPALKEGKIVLCDRYTLSTYVYQSLTGNWQDEELKSVLQFGSENIVPDYQFVFFAPLEICKRRMYEIDKIPDRLESKSDDFFRKIHKRYEDVYEKLYNTNNIKIDATKSIEEIIEEIISVCL